MHHKISPALLFTLSALGLCLAKPALAAPAPDFNYDAYTRSVEQTLSGQMQQFADSSQALEQAVSNACSTPSAKVKLADWPALVTLQQQWQNSYQQWQQLQMFPLGPNSDVTVRLTVSFWPDRKNLVERKARALLKQGDQAQLKQGGIALQGLTASEYLLFDAGHLQRSTPAESCHLLSAISQESHKNAQQLKTRWQNSEFLSHWHDAALGNDSFASTKQATGYLMEGLAQTLEQIAKYKLHKPFRLNDKDAAPNPYLAEAWRSGQGLVSLQSNIRQIRDYYLGLPTTDKQAGRDTDQRQRVNGPDQLLRHLGFADEADAIVQRLTATQNAFDRLSEQADPFRTMAGKAAADSLHRELILLEKALKKPLPHFQLAKRFNSADGD